MMQNFREKYAYKISLYLLLITIAIPILNAIPYFISGVNIFIFPVDVIYFVCALIFSSSVFLRIYSQEVSKYWIDVYFFLAGVTVFLLSKHHSFLFIFCKSVFMDWGSYSYECPWQNIIPYLYLFFIHKTTSFVYVGIASLLSIKFLVLINKRDTSFNE